MAAMAAWRPAGAVGQGQRQGGGLAQADGLAPGVHGGLLKRRHGTPPGWA